MNPRLACRGALALAVVLAGAAPALAQAPLDPEAQYRLSLDPHFSLATGADATQSLATLYSELDARVLPLGRVKRSVGIPLRLLKAVVLDHALATWLVVLDHEVFGHGGRVREFGSTAGYHLGSPWQGRSSYTTFDGRGLSSRDLLRVFSGGSEANGWSATALEREIVGGRPLRLFELLYLVRSRLVVSQYVLHTTPDPQREPLRFFHEWSGGGDVARYLGYRNEIFFGRPGISASGIEAGVIDGYRQLERQARWNALDPAVWIGLWSVGQRVVRGDERSPLTLPEIHGRRFLPVPTADWLPAGGVISLETIVGQRPGSGGARWFSFTVRRGSGPGGVSARWEPRPSVCGRRRGCASAARSSCGPGRGGAREAVTACGPGPRRADSPDSSWISARRPRRTGPGILRSPECSSPQACKFRSRGPHVRVARRWHNCARVVVRGLPKEASPASETPYLGTCGGVRSPGRTGSQPCARSCAVRGRSSWVERAGPVVCHRGRCSGILFVTSLLMLPFLPADAQPADVPADWWVTVGRQIADSEYDVSWQDKTALADLASSWQAPNRAHDFRIYFTAEGIRVIPRSAGTGDTQSGNAAAWEWSLKLARWGRVGATQGELTPARLRVEGHRVEYDRGALVERYLNERRGLEQEFTLAEAPGSGDGVLYLDLELGGTLAPMIAADGQAVDFATPRGAPAVHYAGLRVEDSRGQVLRSWFEGLAEPGLRGIRIAFDDTGAAYPLTVDPLATSPAWTVESDQANAQLGVSVATAGDVNFDGFADVIVGAYLYDNGQTDEGRVFVYHGFSSGLSLSPAWTAESDQASAEFGRSVSTAGDVNGDGFTDVIIGAHLYDNGQTDEGRVFVYRGSDPTLLPTPSWTAEGDQASDEFGSSVAVAGDVNGDGYSDVIVGAQLYDNDQVDEGRALVYLGSAAGLATSPAWTAEGNQADGRYGVSTATAGDVNGDGYSDVIVGADFYDNGQTNEGLAFVYQGGAAGLATSPAWTGESNQSSAEFGISVGTAGDVNGDGYSDVIVGAQFYANGQFDEGRAFVYHGSATGLQASAAWTAESDQVGAGLGISVSTAGDVNGDGYADVIVGAFQFDNGEVNEGRALAYHGSPTGLSTSPAWTVESDVAGAALGYSVAAAGDVNSDGFADVIVGAWLYTNGQVNEGRALMYRGSGGGLSTSATWTTESDQASGQMGFSVATAGDVNGDGYADVIVGANRYDNGQTDEGRALAFHGSAAGLSTSPAWTAEGNQANAEFGSAVSTGGDVNGDGYADVVVGAHLYDNGQTDEGRAFVYHGSAAGLAANAAWTAEGNQASADFAAAVAPAGDVNGDGYADVILGAHFYDNGQGNEGRAYVYHGSPAGLGPSAVWTAESDQAIAEFGISVAPAGDVNGDGYGDVIVGANRFDNGQTDEGRAYVYHGSAAGLGAGPAWTAESDQASAQFGVAVGTAGDVNGDGYADVIVGASQYDNVESNEGRAFAYHGSAAGLSASPVWIAESDQASASLGFSVATAGDVNGDGFADVIVGAQAYDNGQLDEGRAFVYHGSSVGLQTSAAWTGEGDQAGAFYGICVAAAGDVNGDGYSDIVVGAYRQDNGQTDEGRAFVYYGNLGNGLGLHPQQRRASDSGPIAHLGAADTVDSFRLGLRGRTPMGRGRVKLEWEVKPLGVLFNGSGTAVGAFTDTGLLGVQLSELATGLLPASPYHWRVRADYNPATTPLALHSAWLTMPWKGREEAMLRTGSFMAAARIAGPLMAKAALDDLTLSWDSSCLSTDTDYAIYEGLIGDFTSHTSRYCSTGGAVTQTLTPLAADTYYLVVPRNAGREGSYGTDSLDVERPQGQGVCAPQQIAVCP